MDNMLTTLFNGKKLYVFKHKESVSIGPKKFGCIEPKITNTIINILELKKNNIFIDIGANFGYYSILVSDLCQKIISVEPLDICVDLIKKSIIENKIDNILIEEVCLSNEEKEVFLNVRDKNIGNSKICDKETEFKSKTILLETLVKNHKLEKIDLIKIDIEGQEPNVINSSLEILKNVSYIIIEVTPNMNENTNKTKEYFSYCETLNNLKKVGFKIYDIKSEFFGVYEHNNNLLDEIIKNNEIDIEDYLLDKKQINVLCVNTLS